MNTTSPSHPVPLLVGVVGHRDLVPAEIPRVRELVRRFLAGLQDDFPGLPLRVISPLAEGADRLVAAEAKALGIPLIVPMPMPKSVYAEDFSGHDSHVEFDSLCEGAEVLELPLVDGTAGFDRKKQYAQLGVFVSSHCHVLLALWDGKPGTELGGTGQVVEFHHHGVMPGYADEPVGVRLIMADDESDLVYHIVCSRDAADGQPLAPFQPLQASWFTMNHERPRSHLLPDRNRGLFRRAEEFNREFLEHQSRIDAEKSSLLTSSMSREAPPTVGDIDELFGIADWLAIHYRERFTFMLRAIHTLAVCMGLSFVFYSDLANQDAMIYAFLAFFLLGASLFLMAGRAQWHRKYLEYRGLAEGMRVQFFWTVAGVAGADATRFAHDGFLERHDVELGWIRNVMRTAALRSDARPHATGSGLELAIEQWIGNDHTGQASYYDRKARERARMHALTQRLSSACLMAGVAVAAILAVMGSRLDSDTQAWMIVLMGMLPLIAATRDAYAHKKAEKELIEQYRFMHQVFNNAGRRLAEARSDDDRRQILRAVGNAALDEHAEWVRKHRDRPLEMGRF